jgi:hypothetical protein
LLRKAICLGAFFDVATEAAARTTIASPFAAATTGSSNATIYLIDATAEGVEQGDIVGGHAGINTGATIMDPEPVMMTTVTYNGAVNIVLSNVLTADVPETAVLTFTTAAASWDKMSVNQLASLLNVKARASADKSTVVNPKHFILQNTRVFVHHHSLHCDIYTHSHAVQTPCCLA